MTNTVAHTPQVPVAAPMPSTHQSEMRLYGRGSRRLYLNASERERFRDACLKAELMPQALGLVLLYTGCGLSEARYLRPADVQYQDCIIAFQTLKRRKQVVREVPVPPDLVTILATLPSQTAYLFGTGTPIDRITAYRHIKTLMATAGITGAQACPKGLRHGFGIHAINSGIQLNLLQKWMGHASMSTTAIYATASGKEEWELARRMW